ncbi:ribosomal L7Ae/L30e/S12e/Gadd45 family protein [Anaerosalibacter massiliensis]|uniref:Ribosomal L7Ae/L30e/S12e/Gadd45 family protein n=1 Tax=Anaerosalibacter massiliensis TaxID=1347392 RepID=A0A9X2MKB5_9FIRM|nr:ribosomal L7Ae/L30e/S12e/Gadd45 family protein [Anaerosalibacter massiliensis]MCR2045635.1 ribosomal L7Ae/L30e/S12e/Gadd45 family protein [Anaerosalibacter massiliensis]
MLSKLNDGNKIVGTKQVKRAVLNGDVDIVFIAKDAENKVTRDIEKLCNEKSVDIIYVNTMKELGNACGIEVSAASAALLK